MSGKSRNPMAIEVLLAEDNPADAKLVIELLKDAKINNVVHRVKDGLEALDYLHRRKQFEEAPRPDLILLDLKMPRMDGHQVLEHIKNHPDLKNIPVLILSSSSAEEDILMAYRHHANCFITKPMDIEEYCKIVDALDNFWLGVVCLPSIM